MAYAPHHIPKRRAVGHTCRRYLTSFALLASTAVALAVTPAYADGPGRGQTAQFERDYLTFIIDHHYSALRMSELAAGTDLQRDAAIDSAGEGTSPTPGTEATPAKATMEEIKSIARASNRMQREEIVKAQRFLREWYGVTHTPTLDAEDQQSLQQLEQAPAGAQFEQLFLQSFSSHHHMALGPSLDCKVKADIQHDELMSYCDNIVHNQVSEINEMRDLLCKRFAICDFQPTHGNQAQLGGSDMTKKR